MERRMEGKRSEPDLVTASQKPQSLALSISLVVTRSATGEVRTAAEDAIAEIDEGEFAERGLDCAAEEGAILSESPVLVDHVDEVEVVVEWRELSPRRAALLVAGFVGAWVEAGAAIKVDVIGDEIRRDDNAVADMPVGALRMVRAMSVIQPLISAAEMRSAPSIMAASRTQKAG